MTWLNRERLFAIWSFYYLLPELLIDYDLFSSDFDLFFALSYRDY